MDIMELNKKIEQESAFVDAITSEISKVIVGQKTMVRRLIMGLLANGHILLEGVPGLAKTQAITALAKSIDAKFSRIQFTPDLLPADITGTMIYSPKDETFSVKRRDRYFPILFWQTRLTVHRQRCSRLYLKQCRKGR